MDRGYKLSEIDDMDIGFFFELNRKKQEKSVVYAEQVPWL
jgi:hypothetical protein